VSDSSNGHAFTVPRIVEDWDGEWRVAAQDDRKPSSSASVPRALPAPYRSTASFVAAIRRADEHALRQFFLFYSPLLRDEGRRMGLGAGDRREMATTVLDDVAMRLQAADFAPKDLTHYLVGALRNRVRSRLRDANRAHAHCERAYSSLEPSGELVVAECHSSYGLRVATASDDDNWQRLDPAIRRLAEFSAQALSEVEATLMVGLGRLIPLRELAEHAGISYGAARVRVHRLRERFRKLALHHLATLGPVERLKLEQFFRRAGVILDDEHSDRRRSRPGDQS
jgi:DNA-directed RNA polymerase specialized sigma24 family protein